MAREMNTDQMRLRLHSARTMALETQVAATRRWGAQGALTVAMNEVLQRFDTALNVLDELVQRGER